MGKVTLWLCVYEEWCPSGKYELWVRTMSTDFAPRREDDVHLWDDEEVSGGPRWSVRRSYWNIDGSYHCELTYMVVDPNEANTTTRVGGNYLYASAWRTESDGRPEPGLRRGGWVTYDEYKKALAEEN